MPAEYHQPTGHDADSDRGNANSPSSSVNRPPWSSHHRRMSSSARLASRSRQSQFSFRGAVNDPRGALEQGWATAVGLGEQVLRTYRRLPLLYQVLAALAVVTGWVVLILMFMYSGAAFMWLAGVAKSWRDITGGWIVMMLVVAVTAFPPMIGYSTACTIAGFVYGLPKGWVIASVGATFGSLGAFMASRTVLSNLVDRLVGHDKRFIALGQVLRKDGIWYLTGIRFCPLPFSLSNGFLATIPTITPLAFFISTALSMPKLIIHIFIGSRLAALAEDEMSFGDKLINYIGMALGGILGFVIGIVIYRRTMARAAELALADEDDDVENGEAGGFYDSEATMMDPEDAAEILNDDDISLWDTQVDDNYRDDDGQKSANVNGRK